MWFYIEPFLGGFIVGIIFKLLHLSLPGPVTITAVIGVVGLYIGYVLIK